VREEREREDRGQRRRERGGRTLNNTNMHTKC
jgi:hypothetical protein